MATLEQIIKAQELESFGLPEWESRLPIRSLYVARQFVAWVNKTAELRSCHSAIGNRLLIEHIDQMLADYRCSARPAAGDLKRLMPTKHGIWKMHPPGLRLYGWCPAPHKFAVVTGALEIETKRDKTINNKKRLEVLSFIKKYNLPVILGDVRAILP